MYYSFHCRNMNKYHRFKSRVRKTELKNKIMSIKSSLEVSLSYLAADATKTGRVRLMMKVHSITSSKSQTIRNKNSSVANYTPF